MRGSISSLLKKQGCGTILGEDGCELYFDQAGLAGIDPRQLSVGRWVEYREEYTGERMRAVEIRPIDFPHRPAGTD